MKTISLKKVSAVAVASLGFGLLSVVPASAAPAEYTFTRIAATPAIPVVGSVVTVPFNSAIAASDAITLVTFTGTLATVPANSALTSSSPVGTIASTDAAYAAAGITAAASTNTVTSTTTASSTAVTSTTAVLGAFTFTPDVPGTYKFTITAAGSTGTPTFATNLNTQNAKFANMVITVAGAQLSQATSGKGTATGTATTGGSAAVFFTPRVTTATVSVFNITSSGVGSVLSPVACASQSATVTASVPTCAGDTGASGSSVGTLNGTNYADGIKYISPTAAVTGTGELTGAAANGGVTFLASSSTAGTQTITITEIVTATGAPTTRATVTITWGASPTTSSALSTSFACPGAVSSCSADATVLAAKTAKTAAADRAASIFVTVRDSAGTDLTSATALTVTIVGPGTLGINSSIGSATSAGRALTGTAGQNTIAVYGDGTEGKATITISAGTTVLATETVSFYGAVAKVTASQNLSNPLANGYLLGSAHATSGTTMTAAASWANASGNLPAVQLTLTDASGNLIPSQQANISAVSSDATVMSKTITAVEDTTATYGAGTYNVSVSSASGSAAGKSATLTFRVLLADGTTYVSSAPVTFTTGSNKISKVVVSFDKTSYTAGDPAVMTVKATDAAGLAVADGLYASSTYAAPLFSKSIVAISTMPGDTTMVTIGGKKDYKFYAPAVPGTFTAKATYIDSLANLVDSTATASVADANAGLLTQIDALNAKIVALNALIAKIMKKLGVK